MTRLPLLIGFFAIGLLLPAAPEVAAQPLADTLLSWRSYADERSARIRLYHSGDEDRPRTAVVDERAESAGGPVTDEVRYVAETIGRAFGFDPAGATFVFRFSAASFVPGAGESRKVLLLRATFRRADSGALGAPSWRVLSRDELDGLTDRGLR